MIEGKAAARGGDVKQSGSVDRRFAPGETLPLHGGIETVDTRGHTAGHVSLFLPGGADPDRRRRAQQPRAGCRARAPQHTADAARRARRSPTLAALRPDSIVFGHGPSIVGGAAQQLDDLDRSLG